MKAKLFNLIIMLVFFVCLSRSVRSIRRDDKELVEMIRFYINELRSTHPQFNTNNEVLSYFEPNNEKLDDRFTVKKKTNFNQMDDLESLKKILQSKNEKILFANFLNASLKKPNSLKNEYRHIFIG